MKEIKNIAILRNVVIYNKNHDKDYFTKKGVMIIEFEDNTRNILDLESNTDITNCKHLETKVIKGKTKIKTIFREEFLNW